jgi:heme oxygenase
LENGALIKCKRLACSCEETTISEDIAISKEDRTIQTQFETVATGSAGDHAINAFGGDSAEPVSCRALLRDATQEPHERLHGHAGFAAVKDGTISLAQYRALLARLYGFYLPFERATGMDPIRTHWLGTDLIAVGGDRAASIACCTDMLRYDTPERRLGALYVVEGSALGGRQLYRGLDRLLGAASADGRRFFAGRGAGTGAAWLGYLDRLAAVGPDRAAVVGAAIETFAVFEAWLGGWSDAR